MVMTPLAALASFPTAQFLAAVGGGERAEGPNETAATCTAAARG